MLKEHLWHRQGSAQLEEPRWRTPRTPAEVEFYAQTQATYNHFGHLWDWQQESQEEALRVVKEAHCWALATVAMLEGHIEWLNCSVSCGQHWSCGHSGSCWHSGSRWHSRSRGHSRSRSCRSHRGQMALPAGCPEDPARRQAASPSPVRPKRWVTFEDPEDTKVKHTSPPTTPNRWNLDATGSWQWTWAEECNDLGHPQSWNHVSKNFYPGPGHLVEAGMSLTIFWHLNHHFMTPRSGSSGMSIGWRLQPGGQS